MENIRVLCEKMINDNIGLDIDTYVKELLTIAVMAIVIDNGEYAYEKLPNILRRMNIYAENKSVLEIAHETLENYSEDEELCYADASATRSLSIDPESNSVDEQLNFLISLTDLEQKNTTKMVEKTVNGLIHFMRFGEINSTNSTIVIKDGICTITYDTKKKTLKKKHHVFESGLSQYYTLRALGKLYSFLEHDNNIENKLLAKFKADYLVHEPSSYLLPVTIIQSLCTDKYFKDLLDASFDENNGIAKFISYYNSILHDSSAFTFLSHQIDRCTMQTNTGDDLAALATLDTIKTEISKFRNFSKKYKK